MSKVGLGLKLIRLALDDDDLDIDDNDDAADNEDSEADDSDEESDSSDEESGSSDEESDSSDDKSDNPDESVHKHKIDVHIHNHSNSSNSIVGSNSSPLPDGSSTQTRSWFSRHPIIAIIIVILSIIFLVGLCSSPKSDNSDLVSADADKMVSADADKIAKDKEAPEFCNDAETCSKAGFDEMDSFYFRAK